MSTLAVILSFVLAFVGLLSGLNKFSGSKLATETPGHLDIPVGQYRLAGVLELLAAVGLVLAALGVVTEALGAAAAFGFALLMVFATGLHIRAGDGVLPSEPGEAGWGPAIFVLLLSVVTGVLILV